MKINVKIILNNNEKIVKAIKKNNEIIYNDDCLVKIIDSKIIRENDDFILELDFKKKTGYYLLKETNTNLKLNFKVNKLEYGNGLKVEYVIEDEIITYQIEEV